jgi:hypothetical protein
VKKEHWILGILAAVVVLYFLWPHVKTGYGHIRQFVGGKKVVVTGTAGKGNDSGGVLTSSESAGS